MISNLSCIGLPAKRADKKAVGVGSASPNGFFQVSY
jgi:hypothetical protein